MSLLCWNRGLRNPHTIHELRDIIHVKSPHLVFLSETKRSTESLDKVKNSLGLFGVAVAKLRTNYLQLLGLWSPIIEG